MPGGGWATGGWAACGLAPALGQSGMAALCHVPAAPHRLGNTAEQPGVQEMVSGIAMAAARLVW